MLRNILVPLDGSPLADRILSQVRRVLLHADAEVMLLRVLPDHSGTDPLIVQNELDAATQHLETWWRHLAARGIQVRYDLMTGDPAGQILRFAESYHPSFIAMSTHGRSGIERWAHGSVTERVMRCSPFPLLVSNPGGFQAVENPQDPRFRKILVPLDGSSVSARIMPLVEQFARIHESEVVLFHAANIHGDFAPYPTPPASTSAEEVREMLAPCEERLRQAGIPVRIRIAHAPPAAAILDAAEAEEPDLVAMTTHGRTGLSRWLFGSVAEKVLRRCPCPLLVERTGGFGESPAEAVAGEAGVENGAEHFSHS